MSTRSLSYSEVSTAATCTARWDFSYGGRLAGNTLKARHVLPILRDGRAWGAGVAAYHAGSSNLLGLFDGVEAMRSSIDADLNFMIDSGVATDATFTERGNALSRLEAMLRHYVDLTDPLGNLTRQEDDIVVPVPSRTGARGKLQPRWLVELLRQFRWYAWARQRETGRKVVGILVDERLNAVPNPPRILKDGTVSNDKRQFTTGPLYLEACRAAGQDPDPEMVMNLQGRIWQQRVPILFRPGELEEAGRELPSAAIDIRDLDSGFKWPTRNASERTCGGCRFRRICNDPYGELVDELFIRTVPKRLRDTEQSQPQEVAA
jgi:hypothetical protein